MSTYDQYEDYLDLEEEVALRFSGDPRTHARDRGKRKARKQAPPTPVADMDELDDSVAAWVPTYASHLDPRHFERQWIIESLGSFYQNRVITDVFKRVKGGKEANVYCCRASPEAGVDLIAAKLYRPRTLRTLKNDAIYKAGRQLRSEEGKLLKGRREKLAIRQKTRFGKHLDMVWWIGNEFGAQQKLYEAGANVPRPIGHAGNAILMDYVGDEAMPAPTLSDITLDRNEADALFEIVMRNIRLMLDNHFVHGDLSAFNILYRQGQITIIDFPQMVDARTNPHAYKLLQRDIERVCQYFARFGRQADPVQLSRDLWLPYMGNEI